MARRIVAVLVAVLAFAACSAPEKGTVYGRWYYPESQWVQMVCTAYAKSGACSFQVPVIQTDPERWSIGLRDGEEEGQRSVTEREYESCRVGDEYPDCGGAE
jgi:hypothetical protein